MIEEFITLANPFSSENISSPQKCWVYIASPYSIGNKLENVLDQFRASDELLHLGFHPVPPLWTHFWDEVSPKRYEAWMEYDEQTIKRCDCLLRLPGESAGADQEVEFALNIGVPVFYSIQEVVNYSYHG